MLSCWLEQIRKNRTDRYQNGRNQENTRARRSMIQLAWNYRIIIRGGNPTVLPK